MKQRRINNAFRPNTLLGDAEVVYLIFTHLELNINTHILKPFVVLRSMHNPEKEAYFNLKNVMKYKIINILFHFLQLLKLI